MAKSPVAGICPTCLHSGRCHLSSQGGEGPIHSCEEFEPGRSSGGAPPAARSGSELTEVATDGPLGLCASCSRQAGCSYTRPEGGIWHCEDYA